MSVDRGLTHVALVVRDLDASLAFYREMAGMVAVHTRGEPGSRVAWMSDGTRPFVVVLAESAELDANEGRLTGFAHLGVGCASRAQVDELCERARAQGRAVRGPHDSGPPAGYWAFIADPDGHQLELAYGQEVALTVASAASSWRDAAEAWHEDAAEAAETAEAALLIAAEDCRARGLAPLSLALSAPGWVSVPFPEERCYLRLSGPPGGPEGFELSLSEAVRFEADSARAVLERRFAGQRVEMGGVGPVAFGGEMRLGFSLAVGESQARAWHLLMFIPLPASGDGLLVDAWMGGGAGAPPEPGELAERAPLGALLRSARLTL